MFKLTAEAKSYYKRIKDSDAKAPIFNDEWDLYYLSLMLGLANNKKNINAEFVDMLKKFTKKYKDSRDSIVTLLIIAHANRRKLDLSKKNVLESVLNEFYGDSESMSGISEEGMKQMNYYAAGGFDIINDIAPVYTRNNGGAIIKMLYKKLKTSMDKFANANS